MVLLWTDECAVGVESLDADHIIIFSLIKHIDESIRSDANRKTIRSILKILIYHAISHFQHEEKLMEKHGYPEIMAHKTEHHRIVTEMQLLLTDYEENPAAKVNSKIVEVLAAWANEHVEQWDMRYRPYLTDQGA